MYAHERDRHGNSDFIVEEGATVRERQTIVQIPDSTSLQVEINVNESLIQFVEEGMPAKINPVGMGDIVLLGTVEKVNRYAEPSDGGKPMSRSTKRSSMSTIRHQACAVG